MSDPIIACPRCNSPVKGELTEFCDRQFYWFRCMKCKLKWTRVNQGAPSANPAKRFKKDD